RLRGDLEDAIQAYRNLLSKNVSNQTEYFARINLAECLEEKRDFRGALEVLQGVSAELGDMEAITRKIERLKSSIESISLEPSNR
ncbi:MAG: tetratricopeptide repeat protein, partial [Acidobacteriota bacterium]